HAEEHLGPVLGFGPARARVDGEDGILAVVGPGEEGLQLHLVYGLLQTGQLPDRFGGRLPILLFDGELEEDLKILGPLAQSLPVAHLLPEAARLRRHLLGFLGIIPEARLSHGLLQFRDPPPQPIDVKDTAPFRRCGFAPFSGGPPPAAAPDQTRKPCSSPLISLSTLNRLAPRHEAAPRPGRGPSPFGRPPRGAVALLVLLAAATRAGVVPPHFCHPPRLDHARLGAALSPCRLQGGGTPHPPLGRGAAP